MSRSWRDMKPFLAGIEERYRKERLRHGPAAHNLPEDLHEQVLAAIREVCQAYLHAHSIDRVRMRTFFRASYTLPMRVAEVSGEYARAFEQDGTEQSLRSAAAALILEGGTDIRDSWLAFKYLWEAAIRKGVDPKRVLASVPGLSPPKPPAESEPTETSSFAARIWGFLRRNT